MWGGGGAVNYLTVGGGLDSILEGVSDVYNNDAKLVSISYRDNNTEYRS